MHKYTNYNIIEIYINRLSTTMQIFIAIDWLERISEKYLHFKTKGCGKKIFVPHRRSIWIDVLQIYFSNYVYLKDMYKFLKEIGIIQFVSKLITFVNL